MEPRSSHDEVSSRARTRMSSVRMAWVSRRMSRLSRQRVLGVLLAALGLGDGEAAEGAQAVGGVVQDHRERRAQLVTVGVLGR